MSFPEEMDGIRDHDIKQNNPPSERQIYIFSYMWNLELKKKK
jgi:hypothetical protein